MDNETKQRIVFEDDARNQLLEGAGILNKAVRSTMGPSGHSVIIDNDVGGPTITKDGVTVAKAINLRKRLPSMGAELLKEIASKTNDLGGDGTTTATVLGHALLKEGSKLISTGYSSIELKQGMDKATETVLQFLKDNCMPISGKEDIINVGTISANGDREIGELIADAINTVGKDGIITVEPAKSVKTGLNVAEGIQLGSGFISPYFITNGDKQVCELEEPCVLITPNKISSLREILPVLEQVDNADRSLLIVAGDVEGEALHTLVVNKTKGILKVCAIKAPSYGDYKADILSDLGVVVNGTVLGAASEISLDKIKLDQLGRCKKAVINRNSCTFLVEDKDTTAQERIKERVEMIREALKNDPTLDELRANKFRERLAKLSGGIAIISVGGSTEVEILEKKDRVEDAVNATQAASQEGIIPGGGAALFYAAQHLKNLIRSGAYSNEKEGFIAGIQTVASACEVPLKTIVENTGESNDVVSNRLIENWTECKTVKLDMSVIDSLDSFDKNDIEELKKNILSQQQENKNIDFKFRFGFDANNKIYDDLIELGIIDPVKVARLALSHAVSVIGLMLTCNAVVVNEEEEKK